MNEVEIRIHAVNDAKRGLRDAIRDSKDAGREMGHSMAASMRESGEDMADGITASLGTLPAKGGPIGLAIGAAIAAALLPAVGAAINAGALLGLGGGVLAAGIKAASNAPEVQAAWVRFKDRASDSFKDFGKPFEGPVRRALETFGDLVERLAPSFNRLGESIAPVIDMLAPALASMAERAMPGIEKAVKASVPMFETLASKLPAIGDAISGLFSSIADGSKGANKFFSGLMDIIPPLVRGTGKLVGGLSRLFEVIAEHEEVAKLRAAVDDLRNAFRENHGWISKLVHNLGVVLHAAIGTTMAQWRMAIKLLSGSTRTIGHVIDVVQDLGSRARSAASRARSAFNTVVSAARSMASGVRAALSGLFHAIANPVDRGVRWARAKLGELVGAARSVVDRVQSAVSAVASFIPGRAHGGVIGAATGGVRSGWTMVGEQGRELVRLPAGSTVIPNGQTEQMLSGSGGGGTVLVRFDVNGLDSDLKNLIRKMVRAEGGGNVQVAFGA